MDRELIVVGIDDTDDVSKETSTGSIAQSIADAAVVMGGELRLGITRHQLLISDEVPYTSHNSAMVFEALIASDMIDAFCRDAESVIAKLRAPTSNPGFCIARPSLARKTRNYSDETKALIDFGEQAKVRFCKIEEAYGLAESVSWVSLKSCGGNEAGVVGALAGVGLRMGGNDGRFRGKYKLFDAEGEKGPLTVGAAIESLEASTPGPVSIVDVNGSRLDPSMPFLPIDDIKPIMRNAALVIICEVNEGVAHPFSKDGLNENRMDKGARRLVCEEFERDNDSGECEDDRDCCLNCLYRRWVAEGFICVKDNLEAATLANGKGRP